MEKNEPYATFLYSDGRPSQYIWTKEEFDALARRGVEEMNFGSKRPLKEGEVITFHRLGDIFKERDSDSPEEV